MSTCFQNWVFWKSLPAVLVIFLLASWGARAGTVPESGFASWYGEEHRGRLMANGRRFDPDKLTAASWFYPLGTKVRVTLDSDSEPARSVVVTITDRGPSWDLVRGGRIIDLSHAPFRKLAKPSRGLTHVKVELEKKAGAGGRS